jgi:hypothetical protein
MFVLTYVIVISPLWSMVLPSRSRSRPFPSLSVSYSAAVASPDAWFAISTQGIMQSPAPGNSKALDRYIASTHIQSSKVNMPVSSSHQYFAHQLIDSVEVRNVSNSRKRLLSFALTAGLSVVPVSSSRSSSLQNVGRSSSGRNLIYSVRGFRTPISWVSGQQIVVCSRRKVSTAPRVVCQTC